MLFDDFVPCAPNLPVKIGGGSDRGRQQGVYTYLNKCLYSKLHTYNNLVRWPNHHRVLMFVRSKRIKRVKRQIGRGPRGGTDEQPAAQTRLPSASRPLLCSRYHSAPAPFIQSQGGARGRRRCRKKQRVQSTCSNTRTTTNIIGGS